MYICCLAATSLISSPWLGLDKYGESFKSSFGKITGGIWVKLFKIFIYTYYWPVDSSVFN